MIGGGRAITPLPPCQKPSGGGRGLSRLPSVSRVAETGGTNLSSVDIDHQPWEALQHDVQGVYQAAPSAG